MMRFALTPKEKAARLRQGMVAGVYPATAVLAPFSPADPFIHCHGVRDLWGLGEFGELLGIADSGKQALAAFARVELFFAFAPPDPRSRSLSFAMAAIHIWATGRPGPVGHTGTVGRQDRGGSWGGVACRATHTEHEQPAGGRNAAGAHDHC